MKLLSLPIIMGREFRTTMNYVEFIGLLYTVFVGVAWLRSSDKCP